jgi:hypothetical protein
MVHYGFVWDYQRLNNITIKDRFPTEDTRPTGQTAVRRTLFNDEPQVRLLANFTAQGRYVQARIFSWRTTVRIRGNALWLYKRTSNLPNVLDNDIRTSVVRISLLR